ncbi:Tim10-like [Dillenia turbinata]|uniref:Mitochondrial import inner membrane translocase subunit n=1 Tax=Dillenia turbinata TaxID=194707 RepID=A0AAN8Z6S0_9MAGN
MDNSILGILDSLPEEDKAKMNAMVEQLQLRDRSIIPISLSLRGAFDVYLLIVSCWIHIIPQYDLSLRMYNSLVERCFTNCVESFRRKTLDKQEETCVRLCAEKFLKHSMRVGMRFAELNQGTATQD